MSKFGIVAALVVGLGAVYGVYAFRSDRLTASTLSDIGEAQERLSAVDKQAEAAKQYETEQADEQSREEAKKARQQASARKALAQLKDNNQSKLDPNFKARIFDTVPPEVSVVPNESMPDAPPDVFTVQFETTKGPFMVEFHKEWAPNGAARLYELVKSKFFTDMRVFRAVENFVVQFGIPGDPKVSEEWLSKNIEDDPVHQSNVAGTFTFAAAGAPNTRATQVFVNLADNVRLDSMGFAPVGKVVFGMDVVKSLYSGYGEQVTKMQEMIARQGNAFLDQNFPELDSIKRAVFVSEIKDVNAEIQEKRERFTNRMEEISTGSIKTISERAPDSFKVKLECTMGDIVVECKREWAPLGADRFYTLVKKGFYNDAKFFRVVTGTMAIAQFGLPADPKGFGDWLRSSFADDPVKLSNSDGTIAFAAAGKNSRTTQVFFNFSDNASFLDPQGFAPFGKIIEGLDVAKKINAEYGEKPDQGMLRSQGNQYLAEFPHLDGIKTATLIE